MSKTQSYFNRQNDHYALEDGLARELQKRKIEEERKRKEYERICAQSEEIRKLHQQIQTAYVTKERTQQLAETQLRRIYEIKNECDIENQMLRKREIEYVKEKEMEKKKLQQRLQGKLMLQQQMVEKLDDRKEAKQQYEKEKGQVNDIIQKMIKEDREQFEKLQCKKKKAYKDMENTLADKQQKIWREKQIEEEENQKYLDYIKEKERQAQEIIVKKQEENAVKLEETMMQKLKEEEERRRQEEELLTNLRFDLQRELYDKQEKEKARDEMNKRHQIKQELMNAQVEARIKKERERELEVQREKEFKETMLRKFAQDDEIEKMNQQKRWEKEREHRKQIEEMWKEKKRQYEEERMKELELYQQQMQKQKMEQDIIAQERQRLIRENIDAVGEYLPKGLIMSQKEHNLIHKQSQTNYGNNFRIL